MKKVIFILVFVLTASLSFSNNNEKSKFAENKSVTVKYSKLMGTILIDTDLYKLCKITHNVIDNEGNLMGTYVYNIEISEGTCSELSADLKPFTNWLANGVPGL